MKILTLQIKRPYLEDILSGTKTKEYREIRPKNADKYIIQNPDAEYEDQWLQPVKYDAIKFLNGYATDRPEVVIEITNSEIELSVDENGEEIEAAPHAMMICKMKVSEPVKPLDMIRKRR